MTSATDDMQLALERDDLEAWALADECYHRALLDLCGNKRIASMANTVREQGHRARMVTLRLREKPINSIRDHRALLEAIEQGDWKSAKRIHSEHRQRASEELTRILEKYNLPQL